MEIIQKFFKKNVKINCRSRCTKNHYKYKANTLAGATTEPVSCCYLYNCVTCKCDTGNQASWSANVLIQSANQLI